jgi:V8-like Glu-specific endopeptidase
MLFAFRMSGTRTSFLAPQPSFLLPQNVNHPLRHADRPPYALIGELMFCNPTSSEPCVGTPFYNWYWCTAFQIAANYIVTAAHCLYDPVAKM